MSYNRPPLYAPINSGEVNALFILASTSQHTDILITVKSDFDDRKLHNYHIHDGSCGNNPNHWDPLSVKSATTTYSCNSKDFKTCEVGDLSGKFGKLAGEVRNYNFTDPTITFDMLVAGKLSIVIHKPDSKDQLACANLSFNKFGGNRGINAVGKRFFDKFIDKVKDFGKNALNTFKSVVS